MELSEVIKMALERYDSVWLAWNVYIGVTLGSLGFLSAVKTNMPARRLRALVAVGFVVFAISNLSVIIDLFGQREALLTLADSLILVDPGGDIRSLLSEIEPPARTAVIIFHLFLDTIVVITVALVPMKSGPASDANVV